MKGIVLFLAIIGLGTNNTCFAERIGERNIFSKNFKQYVKKSTIVKNRLRQSSNNLEIMKRKVKTIAQKAQKRINVKAIIGVTAALGAGVLMYYFLPGVGNWFKPGVEAITSSGMCAAPATAATIKGGMCPWFDGRPTMWGNDVCQAVFRSDPSSLVLKEWEYSPYFNDVCPAVFRNDSLISKEWKHSPYFLDVFLREKGYCYSVKKFSGWPLIKVKGFIRPFKYDKITYKDGRMLFVVRGKQFDSRGITFVINKIKCSGDDIVSFVYRRIIGKIPR